MSKSRFQKVADVCKRIYEKHGMSEVFDIVNMKLEANNPEFEGVSYKPCRGCDNDVPSMDGICLICGQRTGTLKFNVWVEIERVEVYEDDEVYRDEDNPIKLGIRDSIEEAVELQEEVSSNFKEI